MVEIRTRMELQGQVLDDTTFTVGGSDYSQLLLKSGTAFSDNFSLSDSLTYSVQNTETIMNKLFVYPFSFASKSIVDGTLYGTVITSLSIMASSSYSATVSKIEAIPVVIAANGTETDLVTDGEIWSGTWTVTGNSPATVTDKKALMFGHLIIGEVVDLSDRLGLRIKITCQSTPASEGTVTLHCEKNTTDLSISVPFVMG